ncbi:MAG: acyltransferase [Prevotella sp.]|nr:acyltransferase [Prevotella sp.]MCI5854341.1 acyltransferase [Prevotella sp.]MDD6737751.1 acyltransferase [Prevotella sp.]MDY6091954.1 acyltransferase [Prevotella sp.]
MPTRQSIRAWMKENPRIKRWTEMLIMNPRLSRPRWYVRWLAPLYQHRGRHSIIYSSVRMDTPPFRKFSLGEDSVIESFACINNAVGDIVIGNHSRVGIHSIVIGPVSIGSHVQLAQGVVVTGLNHIFSNPSIPIDMQGVETKMVEISDDVWIGANATILPGVKIGQHCVVAAGAVVCSDVPAHCVVAGVPAKVIKQLK